MEDTITATYHYRKNGEEKTVEKTYSVKEYVKTFDTYKDGFSKETTALIKSLADYGHYVQPFLSDARGWKIGTDYAEMGKRQKLLKSMANTQ